MKRKSNKFTVAVLVLTYCFALNGCSEPPTDAIEETFVDSHGDQWRVVQDAKKRPAWSYHDGVYVQTADLGFVPQDGVFEGIARVGSHAVLERFVTPPDFVLELDITVASDLGDDCGVMWDYQDTDNFMRLSTSPRSGSTLLLEKSSGQWKTLAKNARGAAINKTTRFSVERIGATVSIFQDGKSVFAARHSGRDHGTIALHATNHCAFSNLKLRQAESTPRITVLQPAAYAVSAPLAFEVTTTTSHAPVGASVAVFANGTPCTPQADSTDNVANRFLCQLKQPGAQDVEARLSFESDTVAQQKREHITTGGVNIVTLGDSHTEGSGDLFSKDGASLSGRRLATQGWQASLEDFLADGGIQSVVFNTGIAGEQTAWLNRRIEGYLDQHADADWALLMIGTNDVLNIPWIRQDGCLGPNCEGSYAQALQEIIDKLTETGVQVWLAKPPPLFGDHESGLYADPASHQNNQHIQTYAAVAEQRVSGYQPGPDLYQFFLGEKNRAYLFSDAYHANGLGSRIVAALWRNVLLDQELSLPYAPEDLIVSLENDKPFYPHRYELDYLETGDRLFVDSDIKLTNIPEELADAIWVQSALEHKHLQHSQYLTLDLGRQSHTMYVAFPSQDLVPDWLSSAFRLTNHRVGISDVQEGLNLYVKENATGRQVFGGASASTSQPARLNYTIAISQPQ